MRSLLISATIGLGALLSHSVYAADAPAAAAHTALCKDGSYFDGTTHKGACRGHQGVKEWLDGSKSSASTATTTTSTATETTAANDDSSATKKKTKKKKDTTTTTTSTPATASTPATTSTATTTTTAATTTKEHKTPTPASQITQKPGGGPGLVWVNTESKVYHCQGDEWYGKTKQGSYMSVADAEKAGAHASHGTACK
jgi:hypothetical protein